jgi:hypothetical protein
MTVQRDGGLLYTLMQSTTLAYKLRVLFILVTLTQWLIKHNKNLTVLTMTEKNHFYSLEWQREKAKETHQDLMSGN